MERFALWFCSWVFMLGLTLFLLLSPRAHSAPACFPGDPTASSTLPVITADSTGCAAVWFCDEGTGGWVIHWVAGTGAECDYGYAKAVAQLALSHDMKVALWDSTFTVQLDPAVAAAMPENILAKSVPAPSKPPASGLTTKEVRVYKLVTSINAAHTFSLVGTTKLGLPCDTSLKVGSLYRIDRTMIAVPKGAVMPAVVFAKCD
jgi:hypothetical protein